MTAQRPQDSTTAVRKQVESVATRLSQEYAERLPARDVQRLVESAYQQLSSTARVQTFLPIFVDRTVRAELRQRVPA